MKKLAAELKYLGYGILVVIVFALILGGGFYLIYTYTKFVMFGLIVFFLLYIVRNIGKSFYHDVIK